MPRVRVSYLVILRVVFLAVTAVAASPSARAANVTWTGAAGGTWDLTSSNWSTGTWANPTTGNEATFATTGIGTTNVTAAINVYSINFTNTTGSWIIGQGAGGSLTFTNGGSGGTASTINITNSVTETISVPIASATGNTLGLTITSLSGTTVDAGVLILSGATSTYVGPTTVSSGTLQLGASNVLPATTSLILGNVSAEASSGVLKMNGNNQTVGSLTFVASDTAGFGRVTGAGTLTVNGPVALVNNNVVLNNSFSVTLGTASSTVLDLGGGVRNFTVAYQNEPNGDLIVAASITDGGIIYSGGSSAGSGILKFSGTGNTFLGGLTVNNGKLTVTTASTPGGATNPLTINSSGASGVANNSIVTFAASAQIGNLAGTVSGTATNSLTVTGSLTINQSAFTTYAGVIVSTTGGVVVTGAQANGGNFGLTLQGVNTYTGPTTVLPSTGIGTSGLTFSGNGSAAAAGTLTIGSGSSTVPGPVVTFDNTATPLATRYNSAAAVGLNNGNITINGNATTAISQTLGALTVSANALNNVISVNSTGAATTLTITSLSAIPSTSSLYFTGTGLTASGGGSSQIFISSITTNGIIPNAYFGGYGSTIPAGYSTNYGVIQYVAPTVIYGNTIDNIGPPQLATTATFQTTGNTQANAGALIQGLIFDMGTTLTIVPTNAPQSANGNTPMNTFSITSTLSNTTAVSQTITGQPGSSVAVSFSGTTITPVAGSNLIFDSTVTVGGTSFTLNGTGAMTINGSLAITGALSLASGTLYLNGSTLNGFTNTTGALTGSAGAVLNLGANTSLTSTLGAATTFAANLNGPSTSSLNISGAFALAFTGNNSGFNGALNISGSTLTLSADSNLGSPTSTLSLGNGAKLTFGAAFTIASTRTITLGTGTTTINSGTAGGEIDAPIGGAGGLTKSGTGTLTLGGASTYAGATVISAGILSLGANGTLPSGTNVSVTPANSGAGFISGLNLNGINQTIGTLNLTMPSTASSGTTVIAGTGTLTLGGTVTTTGAAGAYPVIVAAPVSLGTSIITLTVFSGGNSGPSYQGDLQFSGVISGSGGVNINGSSTGSIVTYLAANTYTGTTTLTQGILYVLANNGIPSTSGFVQATGTTLDLTGGTTATNISTGVGSLSGTGSIILGATSILTVGGDNTSPSTPYSGVISGTGGALSKIGYGTLTLSGANTYTGATTITPDPVTSGGGITFNGSGTALTAGALTIGNGGTKSPTLTFDNTSTSIGNRYNPVSTVSLNNGNITLTGNPTTATAQTLGTLTISGTNNLITVNSNGTPTSLTFTSLNITSGAVYFTGTGLSATAGAGTSSIFFMTAPSTPNGYIPNAFFGASPSTTPAAYSPMYGIYQYVAPVIVMGTVIDNIGPPQVPTNATFQTTGNTTANTGAMIQNLIFDAGSTLMLVPTAGNGPQTANGNTPMTTLAITGSITTTGTTPMQTITGPTGSIVAFGAATITPGAGTNLIFDTPITVTGTGLTLNGAGTVSIMGTNSITGTYAITAGSLVSTTASIGAFTQSGTAVSSSFSGPLTAGAVTVGIGTLSVGTLNTDNTSVASFTQNGTATSTTLTGSLVSTGAVAISSGSLSAVGASMTTFTQNGTATSTTLSGNLSATGAVAISSGSLSAVNASITTLAQSSTGSTTFSGTLTASGAVTVSNGSLSVTGNASVASFSQSGTATSTTFSGNLTDAAGIALTAGTLNLNGATSNAIALTGTTAGPTLALGTNASLTVTPTTAVTFAPTINGPASSTFNYTGAVKLTLSANNSGFAGAFNVSNAGTIAFPAPGTGTVVTALGTGPITLNGGNLTYNGTTAATMTNNITIGTGGTTITVTGTTLTLSGSLTVNGTLTKAQTGTLLLAPGIVVSTIPTLITNNASGFFDVGGNNISVGTLSTTNGGNLALESSIFAIAPPATDAFSGSITGTGATINMNGTGPLQFSKVAQGSVQAAAINVNSGTVQLTGASAITFAAAANFTVAPGATLNFGTFGNNGADATAFGSLMNSGTIKVTGGSGTLAAASVTLNGGTIDLTGTTTAVWQFRQPTATPTMLTTLASSSTATLTAPVGSSFENDTLAPLPIVVNAGTTSTGIDLNVNALLSNGGTTGLTYNFDKQGLGVMQISYPGTTTASISVSGGTLIIASGGTVTGAVGVNSGGKLQVIGNLTSSGTVTVAKGGVLEGTGTITNALSISGTLAGGVSTGTLPNATPNTGQLNIANSVVTFNAGSTLGVGITAGSSAAANTGGSSSGASNNSVIAITGGSAVIMDSTMLTVAINATTTFTPGVPYSYLVGTGFGAGALAAPITNDAQFVLYSSAYALTQGDSSLTEDGSGNLYLNFTPTAAPEPGMLLGIAVLGLFALRLRRG